MDPWVDPINGRLLQWVAIETRLVKKFDIGFSMATFTKNYVITGDFGQYRLIMEIEFFPAAGKHGHDYDFLTSGHQRLG